MDIEDLENSFMFNTGFQSSSALAKQMEYCVGGLTSTPDFLEELRKELDGKVILIAHISYHIISYHALLNLGTAVSISTAAHEYL